ncbi:MAG: hypothetical protein E2O51_07110 [Gammaproteobacteria bacterium]|nr:MAG: hypothetical protein E2O51_07110 [Gammaproteobacteria bacterium]
MRSSVTMWAYRAVRRLDLAVPLLLGASLFSSNTSAEPYLSVRSGFKCVTCHTNPSGGGKRNAFGTAYAQTELAQRLVGQAEDAWTGEINRWFAIGGDLRAGYDYVDIPNIEARSEFGTSRGTVYADVRVIPGLLSVYLDEQIAPGGAFNREAYALLTPANGKYTIKVGQFFLPFGWRLEDDSAFIRQVTGIDFFRPDNGVEVGLELGPWSAQVAVTNGKAGDSTQQTSFRGAYISSRWQLGASYNFDNAALGDRTMSGVFAGLRTGPITWLAEYDYITDETPTGDLDMVVGLLEANWRLTKGHNLKVTYERFDPDDAVADDEQERFSLVWEYSPMQMLQPRIGVRLYDGMPGDDPQNRDEFFAELHVFF